MEGGIPSRPKPTPLSGEAPHTHAKGQDGMDLCWGSATESPALERKTFHCQHIPPLISATHSSISGTYRGGGKNFVPVLWRQVFGTPTPTHTIPCPYSVLVTPAPVRGQDGMPRAA